MITIYADLASEYDGLTIYTSIAEETTVKNIKVLFNLEKAAKLERFMTEHQGLPTNVIDRIGQYIFILHAELNKAAIIQFIDTTKIKDINDLRFPKDYHWDGTTLDLMKQAYDLIQETPEQIVLMESKY